MFFDLLKCKLVWAPKCNLDRLTGDISQIFVDVFDQLKNCKEETEYINPSLSHSSMDELVIL